MMLYTENSKDSIRKLLELISDLEKLQVTKSLAFLYTNNEKSERNYGINPIHHCNKNN